MTGRSYYLTTLAAWRRRAARFVHSHYIHLGPALETDDAAQILVLIDADEGTHNLLEQDAAWEPLPHPLSLKPVSDYLQRALKGQGIAPGATTFDVAELLARVHPLLRHRVF
jgi:hypothetical protein